MKTVWKKTFLVALPLVGLLISAPAAEAHKFHKHKRDHYCQSYNKRHGWRDRGRYDDYYSRGQYNDYYDGRRGWYGNQGPYYDNDRYYPSRYPSGTYYGGPYNNQPYYDESPWWEILLSR